MLGRGEDSGNTRGFPWVTSSKTALAQVGVKPDQPPAQGPGLESRSALEQLVLRKVDLVEVLIPISKSFREKDINPHVMSRDQQPLPSKANGLLQSTEGDVEHHGHVPRRRLGWLGRPAPMERTPVQTHPDNSFKLLKSPLGWRKDVIDQPDVELTFTFQGDARSH